ncbi:MAG: DEAD/DEAH box helicase [Candidatus Anstonellaceae archaeon]
MQLRDYQENTLSLMLQCAEKRQDAVFCLPTGAGKTLIFSKFCQVYQGRVMIAVHRKELMKQTMAALVRLGIQPGLIKAQRESPKDSRVIIAMVETLNRRIYGKNKEDYSDYMLIIDEVHVGNFKKIMSHFDFKFGFSATPITTSTPTLSELFKEIHVTTSIPALISNGYLAKPIVYAPDRFVLEDVEVDKKTGDFSERSINQAVVKGRYVEACAEQYRLYCQGKKTLIFCPSIEISQQVAELIDGAKHLDYNAPDAERANVIKWYQSTPGAVLVNVALLTTGFDAPDTEAVIINRPTQSLPLYMQMCGRGSRVTPHKSQFIIVDMYGCCHLPQVGFWDRPINWQYMWSQTLRKVGTGEAPIKRCPECGYLQHAAVRQCGNCGHEFKKEEKINNIELIEDLRLQSENLQRKIKELFYKFEQIQKRKGFKVWFILFKGFDMLNDEHEMIEYAKYFANKKGQNDKFCVMLATKKFKEKSSNAVEV